MSQLIETVRIHHGRAPLLSLHQQRIERSAAELGLPAPGPLPLPESMPEEAKVRLLYGPDGFVATELGEVGSVEPVALVTFPEPHRPYPHKTTDRAQFDDALAWAESRGADDALLLADGWVAECAIWSVFWWRGGALAGPPLELGVLPGVARARLTALAGGLVEERLPPGDFVASGGFVANAVRGAMPVANLDGTAVPQNVATVELARRFWA